jgi:hypothetical protein
VSIRIETSEQFQEFDQAGLGSLYLIKRDSDTSPALWWQNDEGEWFGTRPIDEDEWASGDLAPASRETLAVPLMDGLAPDGYGDAESFTPFTVLWHDGRPDRDALTRLIDGAFAPDGRGITVIGGSARDLADIIIAAGWTR